MTIIEARGLARTFKSRRRMILESIHLSRPTLDDVFLTLTGRSLRDDSPAGHRQPPGRGQPQQGQEDQPAAAGREKRS